MTRVLVTTASMAGHLRPVSAVVRELTSAGHDVVWATGPDYLAEVTAVGARAVAMGGEEASGGRPATVRQGRVSGVVGLRHALDEVFLRPLPAAVAAVQRLVDEVRPDVVLADQGCLAGPLVAEARDLPRVTVSVSPLGLASVDTGPFGSGLPPTATRHGHFRNRLLNRVLPGVVLADLQRRANDVRTGLGLAPLPELFLDWSMRVADRVLAVGVEALEYPRSDLPVPVTFVGVLPAPATGGGATPATGGGATPAWLADLPAARAAGRPVLLVTQGTVTTDPRNLVLPAVAGLATPSDPAGRHAPAEWGPLVVVTTADRDPDEVFPPASRPRGLRVARTLPFDAVLPHTDVLVTNGGYGGVLAALAAGVPLVVAGTTEDKLEVGNRVARAGCGVALRTDRPGERELAAAVHRVRADPAFRERARAVARDLAAAPGPAGAAALVLEAAARHTGAIGPGMSGSP
ncbi:MAG TPA: glycosyltransferase [Dermatophilaceae bacterium]|nr:glycosyltransferase [Dermatophilaceae bacterium]